MSYDTYCRRMKLLREQRVQLLHLVGLWSQLPDSKEQRAGYLSCRAHLYDTETQLFNM